MNDTLKIALAAVTASLVTGAIVLAIQRPQEPVAPAPVASGSDEILEQTDTVSPQTVGMTGGVVYPIPYASEPNLKLASSKGTH